MKKKNVQIMIILVILCSCSRDYKVCPKRIISNNYTIHEYKSEIVISYKSEPYISDKLFKGGNCPTIIYNSKFFDKNTFFAYRTIPINIDSNIVFIDHYGKGIDSTKYKELEVQFLLNGEQNIKLHEVKIIDECYFIGNERKTKKISKKEIPKIAGKWNLIFKENR